MADFDALSKGLLMVGPLRCLDELRYINDELHELEDTYTSKELKDIQKDVNHWIKYSKQGLEDDILAEPFIEEIKNDLLFLESLNGYINIILNSRSHIIIRRQLYSYRK